MAAVNRQITLASRPVGFPAVSDFRLAYATVPALTAGQVLVRSVYLSLDPYLRERMNAGDGPARSVGIGEVMAGCAVALVVASEHPDFRVDDAVVGMLGWQEYAVATASELRRVDNAVAPISAALGVLGVPGLTAYFGLTDVGQARPGETVLVSGAAGAVGMIAGQIAKIRGCRAVGLAGPGAQISWLVDELGFDAASTCTSGSALDDQVAELCPDGIDVYFDNVGGWLTDAVVRHINPGARIVLCAQVSQSNLDQPEAGPRWLKQLIARQASAQGFRVSDYADRFPEGLEQLTSWLRQGKLRYREDVALGIESAPQAFIGMLHGRNQGKQLVQL